MLQSFKLHTVTLSTEMLQIQKPSFETPLSRLQGTFQKRLKLTHKKLKIFQSTQNRSRSNTIQINMNKQIDNNIDIQYTNYVINSDQIQRKRRKSICNNQQITMIIDNSSKSNNKLAQKQSSKILKKIKTERTNIKIKKINRQKLENKSNSLNIGFGSNEGSEKQREKGGFPMSIIKQKYLQTRHHLLNDRSTQKPSKKIINPTAMYYSMYASINLQNMNSNKKLKISNNKSCRRYKSQKQSDEILKQSQRNNQKSLFLKKRLQNKQIFSIKQQNKWRKRPKSSKVIISKQKDDDLELDPWQSYEKNEQIFDNRFILSI